MTEDRTEGELKPATGHQEASDSLTGFDISPEFIEEQRKLNLVRPRHKFASLMKNWRVPDD